MSLVSVIVPIYNAEAFLSQCLDSLSNQSYQNIEILLINDGSTDRSLDICQRYVNKDPRFRLLNQSNSGVSVARNRGIQAVTGEFTCFVDGDDWVGEEYISSLVAAQRESQADLVIAGVCNVFSETSYSVDAPRKNLKTDSIYQIQDIMQAMYTNSYHQLSEIQITQMLGYPVAKLYRNDLLKMNNFVTDIPIREDALFNLDFLYRCASVYFIYHSDYYYRIHDNSATGRFRQNYTEEVERLIIELEKRWGRYGLAMEDLARAKVYLYMSWVKIYALHSQSTLSIFEKRKLLTESFKNTVWAEAFNDVVQDKLPYSYRILKKLFNNRQVGLLLIYLSSYHLLKSLKRYI